MPQSIKDGSTGNTAKVGSNSRLHTHANTTPEEWSANKDGNAYNINTGNITLTSAADTPIMYVKNNDDKTLHISAIAIGVGPSTGGTGEIPQITVVRNPTAGTTISNANNVAIKSNRNYGSANTAANIIAYKGATGETMTDGDDHLLINQTSNGRAFASIDEILPKGTSMGVKFDPQPSNTSQTVYCALICHFEDTSNED
jgi:hypothetical protein